MEQGHCPSPVPWVSHRDAVRVRGAPAVMAVRAGGGPVMPAMARVVATLTAGLYKI